MERCKIGFKQLSDRKQLKYKLIFVKMGEKSSRPGYWPVVICGTNYWNWLRKQPLYLTALSRFESRRENKGNIILLGLILSRTHNYRRPVSCGNGLDGYRIIIYIQIACFWLNPREWSLIRRSTCCFRRRREQ
jgi:hypothetical protein